MGQGREGFEIFPEGTKLLLVCVNKTWKAIGAYDAARYSWKVDPARAEQVEYVVAVSRGVVVGVFEPNEWRPANKSNFPDISDEHGNWEDQKSRFGFVGRPASNEFAQLISEHVPSKWRFRNPIRYVTC